MRRATLYCFDTGYYSLFGGTGGPFFVRGSELLLLLKRTAFAFPRSRVIQVIVIILAAHEPLFLNRCGALLLLLGSSENRLFKRPLLCKTEHQRTVYFTLQFG